MSRIVVSGASGDLARRITTGLLEDVAPGDLTLVTRTPRNLDARRSQGVRVCGGSFNDPEALRTAYHGADTLMLISGLDVTHRVPEHRNAIAAARDAGIRHIVYTSVAGIHPRNPTLSASDHIVTEADLRGSGLDFTVLRNATYAEVFPTIAAAPALRDGRWHHLQGNGRLAPVSKRDIAACAAACLLDPSAHAGAVYEITGPELVTFRQIATLTARVYGTPIEYVAQTVEERYAFFDALGVPRRYSDSMSAHPDAHLWCSEEMVTAEIAFERGFHAILTDHVEYITGKKPLTLGEVYALCKGRDYADC
jgi:NAD(P)H dehydrogenase (quinone)